VNDLHKLPFDGSYWVLPGTLLAGSFPGGVDDETSDPLLTALLESGIRSVINLLTEEEELQHLEGDPLYRPYEDRLELLGEQRGVIVEIVRCAIDDGNTLTENEMELILDAIDAEIDGRNSPTLVHCSNGNARTGMVIGCYLARHGIAEGKDALARIQDLRKANPALADVKSPESMVEQKFILRWKEGR
jgi:protein tyrosine/serine phosphatase